MAEMTRTDTPPVIDGVLDDEAWSTATVLRGFRQVEPVEDGEPSEETEIRLLYDDDHLYVGVRCFDREPDRIVATQMRRDGALSSDDLVGFVVDTFFDRRNGYYFEMNAAGARGDALVEDNNRFRMDWDGIWYGKSSIDELGWMAEFSIPFKTLSFNPNTTRWSFNVNRYIRRRNESIRWASPSQNIGLSSVADAGVLEGITDIRQGLGLDIKPYSVMTLKRDHDEDADGIDLDGGMDVFYKFTPSLTLALTFNTDFAETEVDERRVNLTRFPLFFPEKRDFFLQDAGIFSFGGINNNPLPFHSRRIGLGPNGEPVDILAGAKLTGRVGGVNLGLLDVQMKSDNDLGDKNLLVGRASVNVLEESTVGAIFTNGDPRTTGDNSIAGVDFNYRDSTFNGDRTLDGHLWALASDSSGADGIQSSWGFKLGYPNDRVNWGIGFSQIDDQFRAALGFVPRPGIREYFGDWRYRWRPNSKLIRSIDSGVRAYVITDLDDDTESETWTWELLDITTHDGDRLSVDYRRQREVLSSDFQIHDGITILAGDYRFDRYSVGLNTSRGRPVSVGVGHAGGEFYTGRRDDCSLDLEWRVSPRLFLGGEYSINHVDLDEGSFTSRIIRGRVNVYFTPDLSWMNYIQYDNFSETVGLNSRVRWIVTPGSEIYFVLNQSVDRDEGSFRVMRTELTTKVGWTFRF